MEKQPWQRIRVAGIFCLLVIGWLSASAAMGREAASAEQDAAPAQPAPVKGPNVTVVTFGEGEAVQGAFVQVGDKSWYRLKADGSVDSTFTESGRDDWSVYLGDASGGTAVLNLWVKKVTVTSGGARVEAGVLSVASTPYSALAEEGVDIAAAAASAAKLGVGLAVKPLVGSVKEGAGATKPNKSLGTLCSALQFASSTATTQEEKARARKAQERLVEQWSAILHEVQTETGVSIEDLDPLDLASAMAQVQADLQEEQEDAAPDQGDVVPTGYLVNDPGGTLAVGGTLVPVDQETKAMFKGKVIVFEGVPGSYTLAEAYDGRSGKLVIEPGLVAAPADNAPVGTKPEWTSFDIARTALEVAGIADPTGAVAVAAAYLHPVCSSQEAKTSRGDYCYKHSDTRGVGIVPIACNPALPDHQAGLCYKPCPENYHGVGPVCWSNERISIPRGAGVIPSGCPGTHPSLEAGLCYRTCAPSWTAKATICYQDCPAAYRDDGLYCGKQSYGRGGGYVLGAKAKCNRNHADVGGCERWGALYYPKCKPGYRNRGCCVCETAGCPRGWEDIGVSCKKPSRGRGVGVPRNQCAPNVPDLDAGLCYRSCDPGYNGAGPVCWTEQAISIPRGVGLVPDQCPSGHPEFDAGLCYRACPNPEYAGVGPVCWGGCSGRYGVECGVGCATSELACGLVTTEMVVAPLEMFASILSLGGYSLADKAKDGAKTAFKNAVTEATEASVKDLGTTLGQQAVLAAKRNLDKLDNLSKALTKRKDLIKQAIKKKAFDPAADRIKAAWREAAEKRLEKKILNASTAFEQEMIRKGAEKKFQKQAADATLSLVEKDLIREAAAEAAEQKAAKLLEREEIKKRLLSWLAQSWNSTDKAYLEVTSKCVAMGFNVTADWSGVDPSAVGQ